MGSKLYVPYIGLLLGFKMLFPFPFPLLSQHSKILKSNPALLKDLFVSATLGILPGRECPYFLGLVLGTTGSINCWLYAKALHSFALSAHVSWLALRKHCIQCDGALFSPRGYICLRDLLFQVWILIIPQNISKRGRRKVELPMDPRRKWIPVRNLGLVKFLPACSLYSVQEFFKQ